MIMRYVAKNRVSHRCARETKVPRGGIAPFWGVAHLLEEVSRDMGFGMALRRRLLRQNAQRGGFSSKTTWGA